MQLTDRTEATSETVQRPRLRRLLDYWRDRRGARRMPARADLDPVQFAWMLGDVSLVDVVRETPDSKPRFRFRLIGTRVVERFGYDMTGRWLDELPEPAYRQHVRNAYDEMVQRRLPLIERLDMLLDQRMHDYEILRLPLGRDDSRVDMILLAVDFFEPGL